MVGPGHPIYVIAEAGSNHDRDLGVAHKLVDVASDCGADAVKFQTYSADTLYSRFTPRFREMDEFSRSPSGETPYQLIKRIELPREWQRELRDHAMERGIEFLSTPFDLAAVNELIELKVAAIKIASYDITYYRLLQAAARCQQPIVLSTGNSTLGDVELALQTIYCECNRQVVLLHCVNQYPTHYEDVNLMAMRTLTEAFQVPVGFSDHTGDNVCAIAAVALGACCFEKHFTLDRRRRGPDHPSALEPDELAKYISDIRNAGKSLGSAIKQVQHSEEENHRLARRSLHALIDIPRGTTITAEMLTAKRPALGIHPWCEPILVGRCARTDIQADQWITWDMV
jgi:sialic acid synthase SpsE